MYTKPIYDAIKIVNDKATDGVNKAQGTAQAAVGEAEKA